MFKYYKEDVVLKVYVDSDFAEIETRGNLQLSISLLCVIIALVESLNFNHL